MINLNSRKNIARKDSYGSGGVDQDPKRFVELTVKMVTS